MGSELLTRRMDLVHTKHVDPEDNSKSFNILRMDTSYPVKLNGLIIKLFKATSNFSAKDTSGNNLPDDYILFSLRNAEESDETVVDIPASNVYSFDGKRLSDNEFNNGDYVMTIIDIANQSMFIFSLNNSNDDGLTTKHMTYHCNGKNDNVVLREIVNILVDMYDYSTEDIADTDYDIDNNTPEFNIKMTDTERREHLLNEKFTVSIVGKWGTDYSNTTFVYGGFNRQNRSSIMSISGTNKDRDSEIEYDDDNFDNEIVLDWSKCYVPKIRRNNNEIYAALFNCIALNPETNEWEQYDFWTKEYGKAHFTDEEGNAYGNLFPRRLAFLSIDGALPLNITIKGLTLRTFSVGIYIESESDKRVRIEDCKITICDESYVDNVSIPDVDRGDVNSNFHFFSSGYTPLGTAIDINSARAKVCIDNCDIKNGKKNEEGVINRHSNLIVNSSSDTLITRTNVKDFINMSNGYKNAYTTVCLDAEYFPEMYTITSASETLTISSNPEFAKYDFTNPNVQYSLLMFYSFHEGSKLPDGDPGYGVVPSRAFFGEDVTPYTNIQDLTSYYNIDPINKTITIKKMGIVSRQHPDTASYTIGAIKNIPILYRSKIFGSSGNPDSYKYIGMKYVTGESPTHDQYINDEIHNRTLFNREYEFTPSLRISDSTINCAGILYQNSGQVIFDNCKLYSKLYDLSYNPNPINLHSGTLTISNCIGRYDTRDMRYTTTKLGWRGYNTSPVDPLSFIKVYPTINILKDNNLLNSSDGSQVYDYLLPNGASIPLTNARLNLIGSNITLFPDYRFNIPNNDSANTEDDSIFEGIKIFSRVPSDSPAGTRDSRLALNNSYMTLSFINVPKNVKYNNESLAAPFNTRDYFNPVTAPVVNIDSCNFDVVNSGPSNEIATSPDNTVWATVARIGKNVYNKYINNSNYYSGVIADFETETLEFNGREVQVIKKSEFNYDSYKDFINIMKYDMPENENNIQTIRIYNTNGHVISLYSEKKLPDYYIVKLANYEEAISGYNPSTDLTTIMYKIGMINEYGLYLNIARLNNDLSCELDSSTNKIMYTNPETGDEIVMQDEHPSDHILISKLYEHDILNNTLYTPRKFAQHLEGAHVDTLNRYKRFGVIGFVLNDCVFNMSNSSVGGPHGTAMRNAYNMETFVRRSPRITFEFRGNGHYNINNTKALAWSTVLWSQLFDGPTSIVGENANYKHIFDSTNLILGRNGGCHVNNCTFINPNSVRFKNTQEDWLDFVPTRVAGLDVNQNYSIYDKGEIDYTLTGSSKIELRQRKTVNKQRFSIGTNTYSSTGFAESVQNCNEMPIIFGFNSKFNPVKIKGSTIIGNETVILNGDIEFDGTTYINNSNGMMVYISTNKRNNRNTIENQSTQKTRPAEVVIRNCDIRCTKDVMWDRYIDSYFGKDYNTEMYYYENCDDKGMKKYNNAVAVIYMENNIDSLKMENNRIIFKPNSFRSMYGINIDSPVNVVHVHNYYPTNVRDKGVASAQQVKPFIFKDNDVFMAFNCPHIPNSIRDKVLPNSNNMAVISLTDNKKSDFGSPVNVPTSKSVIINGNTFNVYTFIDKAMSASSTTSHRLGIIYSKPSSDGSTVKVPNMYCHVPYEILLDRVTRTQKYTIDTGNTNSIDMTLDYNSMTDAEILAAVGGGTVVGNDVVKETQYPLITIDMENIHSEMYRAPYNDNLGIRATANPDLRDKISKKYRGNRMICTMSGSSECTFEDYEYNADKRRYENIQRSCAVDVCKDLDTGIVTVVRGERINTYFFNPNYDHPQIIRNSSDQSYNTTDETYVVASFNMPVLYTNCYTTLDMSDNIFNSRTNGVDETFNIIPAGENKLVFGSNTILDIELDSNSDSFDINKGSIINICRNIFSSAISRNLRVAISPSPVEVNGYGITVITPDNIAMNEIDIQENSIKVLNRNEHDRLEIINYSNGLPLNSYKSTFGEEVNEGHIVDNHFHNIKISTDSNRCVGLKFNEYNAKNTNLVGFSLYSESDDDDYLKKVRTNVNKDFPLVIDLKRYHINGEDIYFNVLNLSSTDDEFYVAAKTIDSRRSRIKLKPDIEIINGSPTNNTTYIVNISECSPSTAKGFYKCYMDMGTGTRIEVDIRNSTTLNNIETDGDAMVYLKEGHEFLFITKSNKMSTMDSNYLFGDDIRLEKTKFKRGDVYKIISKFNCNTEETTSSDALEDIIALQGINSDDNTIITLDGSILGNRSDNHTINSYTYDVSTFSPINLPIDRVTSHIYKGCVGVDKINGKPMTVEQLKEYIEENCSSGVFHAGYFSCALPIYELSSDATHEQTYGRKFNIVKKFNTNSNEDLDDSTYTGEIYIKGTEMVSDKDGYYVKIGIPAEQIKIPASSGTTVITTYYIRLDHLCQQMNAMKPFLKYVNEKTYFYEAINYALPDEGYKLLHDTNNLNVFTISNEPNVNYLNNNEAYKDIKAEGININSRDNTFMLSPFYKSVPLGVYNFDDISQLLRSNLSDIYESI